jgi:ATP-dependent HslUV protease ATP-binding subunit HslU
MFEKILPKNVIRREMTVAEARRVLLEQETEALINKEKVNAEAIELSENTGIIFVDELDKVVASEGGRGADVSRQGVQRDLLPIVEGTTVQTRYGYIRTDHILFIAAGAFHTTKPSDLMPELQGRFPIRVELEDLTKEDFVRILSEPHNSLTRQYTALLKTEGVDVAFAADAVEALADYAFRVNQSTQNIGARRLHTIMERLLEDLSFEAPDMKMGRVEINAGYVRERLDEIAQDEDLSKFIL